MSFSTCNLLAYVVVNLVQHNGSSKPHQALWIAKTTALDGLNNRQKPIVHTIINVLTFYVAGYQQAQAFLDGSVECLNRATVSRLNPPHY